MHPACLFVAQSAFEDEGKPGGPGALGAGRGGGAGAVGVCRLRGAGRAGTWGFCPVGHQARHGRLLPVHPRTGARWVRTHARAYRLAAGLPV